MRARIDKFAAAMALLGGFTLLFLIGLICVSVIGRIMNRFLYTEMAQILFGDFAQKLIDLGVGAVAGDFEILEAGIAFSIFAFLPICQLNAAHACVDVFTRFLPQIFNRCLNVLWSFIFAIIIILICQQLFFGLQDKFNNKQTSFFLQFPLWWAYAASFCTCLSAVVVAIYCAYLHVIALLTYQERR